jgi:hypothetical protein
MRTLYKEIVIKDRLHYIKDRLNYLKQIRDSWQHLTITAFLLLLKSAQVQASDLIVNGVTQSIPGGSYDTVIVKNSGSLTVSGSLSAQTLILVTAGVLNVSSNVIVSAASIDGTAGISGDMYAPTFTMIAGHMTVLGNITSSNFTVQSGMMTTRGVSNIVTTVTIASTLVGMGTWEIGNLLVATGGVFQICPFTGSSPSGTIFIHANTIHVDAGGVIDGTGAGNDSRGQGRDWYSSCSGGANGGAGGRGYWNSSGDGKAYPFGYAYTYDAPMGGAGGSARGLNYGGGGLLIEAEQSLVVDGEIRCNGNNGPDGEHAGGAGGTILLRSSSVVIDGHLSANGGYGYGDAGGGGGGRIKISYGNADLPSLAGKTSVSGGSGWQYGDTGTVYRDYIPRVLSIDGPLNGATVTNGGISFQFVIEDQSPSLDGRLETNTPRIEMSRDGFQSIAYSFDQDLELAGWNKSLYYSGDTVIYTPQVRIDPGVYEWRIAIRDGSLSSRYSTPQVLAVETNIPNVSLAIDLATIIIPRVIMKMGVGATCQIDYAPALGATNDWRELAVVPIVSNPQYYLDLSAYGQPQRFYRVRQLP